MRFRKLMVMVLVVLVSFTLAFLSSSSAQSKGNQAKGKYYFKQTCKECHTKGAAGGEITPISKTMVQWQKYFAAGKHNNGKEPLTKVLPEEQLHDASAYLIAHAADSPQPETCGK